MNDIEHLVPRHYRRARGMKMPVCVETIRAFKPGRDCSFIGKTAAFAERRLDDSHLRFAVRAYKSFGWRSSRFTAELARFRIKETQPGVQPAPGSFEMSSHKIIPPTLSMYAFEPHNPEVTGNGCSPLQPSARVESRGARGSSIQNSMRAFKTVVGSALFERKRQRAQRAAALQNLAESGPRDSVLECGNPLCSLHASSIRDCASSPAMVLGCEERATLGKCAENCQPQRPTGLRHLRPAETEPTFPSVLRAQDVCEAQSTPCSLHASWG